MRALFINRRAQGHVEIIISFVLFVAFLLSAFAIFNLAHSSFKRTSLDHEYEVILTNISAPVGKLSILVASDSDCYDDKKNTIQAQFGPFIEAYYITLNNMQHSRIYTLYFGNFFNPSKYGVVSCAGQGNGKKYTLGGNTNETLVIKRKLQDLKREYEGNYAGLSKNLGIDRFSFNVRTIDGAEQRIFSVTPYEKISPTLKVVSDDFPIIVIDDLGNRYEYILNIRLW